MGGVTRVGRPFLEGLAAGALATLPMSAVMLAAGRTGIVGTQPPQAITDEARQRAGVEEVHNARLGLAASVAHVAFGAGGGAGFACLHRLLRLPVPATAQGIAFGLGVWAASYQGWVPALDILPPAGDDRPGRRRVMIAAHAVYGGVLGALEGRASSRTRRGTARNRTPGATFATR